MTTLIGRPLNEPVAVQAQQRHGSGGPSGVQRGSDLGGRGVGYSREVRENCKLPLVRRRHRRARACGGINMLMRALLHGREFRAVGGAVHAAGDKRL